MDPRLAEGAARFNAGDFYEAHEIWEDLWTDERGEARRFVQALVQLAAGYHKLEIGVPGGATKLLTRALATFGDLAPTAVPCRLDELRRDVAEQLALLRATPASAPMRAPRMRFAPVGDTGP